LLPTPQVAWQGSVLAAGRSAYLCAALIALSCGMLAHKARRTPLFNAFVTPGHWQLGLPPATTLLFPLLLAAGPLLVCSRCAWESDGHLLLCTARWAADAI